VAQFYPYLSLVLTAIVIIGGPGPGAIGLASAGAAYGPRRCLGHLAGLVLGTTIALLALAAGLATALTAVPILTPMLITISGVYIAYLAYQIAMAPPLPEQDAASVAPSLAGGLLRGGADPRTYLAIATVLAANHLPIAPLWLEGAVKAGALAALILLIYVIWLTMGASLLRLLRDPAKSKIVNLSLSAALVAAMGLSLLG
jgi:threonine/homoserine/homoserine lactone efflux protein